MKVSITGRHVNVSDRLKDYSEKKFEKLEKYFHQVIDAKIVFFEEKLDKGAEFLMMADGIKFYGKEKAGDFHSCVDLLLDKLEEQAKRYKNKVTGHKAVSFSELPVVDISNENLSINVNEITAKPKDAIEAYLEMKVDGVDFFLFNKIDNATSVRSVAVLYKGENDVRMAVSEKDLSEYKLNIMNDSAASPKIEFKKEDRASVVSCNLHDALSALFESEKNYLPFYNTENNLMNVIYTKGKNIFIDVPSK